MSEDGDERMTLQAALPHRPMTVEDLEHLPDERRRYELVDGSLIVVPPPEVRHELILGRLLRRLYAVEPPGWTVMQAGLGIQLGRSSWLSPDLSLIRASVAERPPKYVTPADVGLVIEVVSPSNATHDLVLKRKLYAEGGIEHYWIVDSRGEGSLTVLRLHEGRYVPVKPDADGSISVTEPVKLTLHVADLIPT